MRKINTTDARYCKVALGCILIAFILFLISFAAPNWAVTSTNKVDKYEFIGIWRACVDRINGGKSCNDFVDYTTGEWLKACQSFMTLSLFTLMGSVGIVAMAALIQDFTGDLRILSVALSFTGVSTFFLLISVSVFGARYEQHFVGQYGEGNAHLSWAFALAVSSLITTFASCFCIFMEFLNEKLIV